MPDELLTIQQAAERLNVPVRFIRRLVAERRIAFHKVGRYVRFRESDLTAFLDAARVESMTDSRDHNRGR